jgi:hypothetical protein
MIAFSFAHARLLGLAITSSSILSYPGVAVLVLQRISFPALARAPDRRRLERAAGEVSAAAAAILIGAEGLAGLTCPWWLPWLFGARWQGAWPLTAGYGACYVLLGQVNVITGALYAAGHPLGALRTWAWMATAWALGAALWMVFARPMWLVSVLLGARVLGLLAGSSELRRAGVHVRMATGLMRCALAAGAVIGGAAAVAAGRTGLILAALALLVTVELSALWAARGALGALATGLRQQRGLIQLSH